MIDEDSNFAANVALVGKESQTDIVMKAAEQKRVGCGEDEFLTEEGEGPVFFELSAGALVFRETTAGEKQILLIKHHYVKHWGFPKGHVKQHEGCKRAAVREVQEETGIHIKIECDFEECTCYKITPVLRKKVIYFLAIEREGQITKSTDKVVKSAVFFNVEEAFEKLEEKNQVVLNLALNYLKNHKELF